MDCRSAKFCRPDTARLRLLTAAADLAAWPVIDGARFDEPASLRLLISGQSIDGRLSRFKVGKAPLLL